MPNEASRRCALRCAWSFRRDGKGGGGRFDEEGEIVSSRRSEGVLGETVALPGGDTEVGSSGRDIITEEMCAFREACRDFVASIEESREFCKARVRSVGTSGRESRMLDVASIGSLASATIS